MVAAEVINLESIRATHLWDRVRKLRQEIGDLERERKDAERSLKKLFGLNRELSLSGGRILTLQAVTVPGHDVAQYTYDKLVERVA